MEGLQDNKGDKFGGNIGENIINAIQKYILYYDLNDIYLGTKIEARGKT
jgi:hypothetical protein